MRKTNNYGRSIKGLLIKSILRNAQNYGVAYPGAPTFRQVVIADVMRQYSSLKESTVSSTYADALAKAREDWPELLSDAPGNRGGAASLEPPSADPLEQPPNRSAKIVGMLWGKETEFESVLPGNLGWDALDEADRVRWVRDVALRGADFDPECIYFRSPDGASFRLSLVSKMSLSDLCLAGLHSVI